MLQNPCGDGDPESDKAGPALKDHMIPSQVDKLRCTYHTVDPFHRTKKNSIASASVIPNNGIISII